MFRAALKHLQAGQLQKAQQICLGILNSNPRHPDALYLLGQIAHQVGKYEAAIDYISRAIALRPDIPEFHNTLGAAYGALGKLDEAVASCERAVQVKPDYAEGHNNLGNALLSQGKLEGAVASYRQALQIKPDYANAHYNLGLVLQDQGRLQEAVASFKRVLQVEPRNADAHLNLGIVFKDQGKLDNAAASYERTLQIKPDYAIVHNNLGVVFKDQGKLEEAVERFKRALQIEPDFATAHSNLLYTEQYRPGVSLTGLARLHAEWDRRHAAPLKTTWRPFTNARVPNRRLRLGFISPDFARHPVGCLSIRALEALDPERCETVCYSDRRMKDELTARFETAAGTWRQVRGLGDEVLAEQIRADAIDILFDLSGHTAKNRMLLFARKPAPIQITWLGYVGTTGLSAMDYLIADRFHVPQRTDGHYREKIIRLPDGYACFDPPAEAPEVGPLPAVGQREVTFGSFNNPAKITPLVLKVWAEILARLPRARLVLKYRGLDDHSTRRRYTELFTACGLDSARLELSGQSPHAELLAEYNRIDLALDPFPYSGGLTTCEALWMGVPVITCPGETFASRHSLSHLSNVALCDTLVGDLSDYVELAVGLAHDLPRLAALRAGLRERVARSPLCDGARFAANLTEAMRAVWRQWCEATGPS